MSIFLLMIIFCFAVCGNVFDYSLRVVMSGSMEPEIPTGSLICLNTGFSAEEIQENDIIAFTLGKNSEVLHRVIKINRNRGLFYTKGDANATEDFEPITFEQYKGKFVFVIPYIGYLVYRMKSYGIWVVIFAAIFLIGGVRKR